MRQARFAAAGSLWHSHRPPARVLNAMPAALPAPSAPTTQQLVALVVLDAWRDPELQRRLVDAYRETHGDIDGFVADPASDRLRPPHVVGGALDLLEWWHWSYGDDVWAAFVGDNALYDVVDDPAQLARDADR